MEINQITRSFRYTVNTILHAKFRNFLKRSLWRYMIAAFMLTTGFKLLGSHPQLSYFFLFFSVFFGLISLSVILILTSSYVLYFKKRRDDMDITFKQEEINVFWHYRKTNEVKSWDWIKSVEESNGIYYLDLNMLPRNVIMLAKQRLSVEENEALFFWITSNGKLKS